MSKIFSGLLLVVTATAASHHPFLELIKPLGQTTTTNLERSVLLSFKYEGDFVIGSLNAIMRLQV